jgi:hypothetical protein
MKSKTRYTTAAEDRAFMAQRMADMNRQWAVGDTCLSYNMREKTTIAAIDGGIVTLANGDQMHVTKVRGAK